MPYSASVLTLFTAQISLKVAKTYVYPGIEPVCIGIELVFSCIEPVSKSAELNYSYYEAGVV